MTSRFIVISLAYCFCLTALMTNTVLADTEIVIIRHGEKPEDGLGQLNCKGFNRALSLRRALQNRFGKPDAIIVPNPGLEKIDKNIAYSYIRPLATVEPLAISWGMPIEATIGFNDLPALNARMEKALASPTENKVLIAWEHKIAEQVIKDFLKKYDVKTKVPHWDDDDFDSIYVISQHEQEKIKFHVEKQGLNDLSNKCPI